MKNNLDSREWKQFDFIDLFVIKNGYYNKKPEQSNDGIIPFIGATDKNNGFTGFYTLDTIEKSSKTGDKNNHPLH